MTDASREKLAYDAVLLTSGLSKISDSIVTATKTSENLHLVFAYKELTGQRHALVSQQSVSWV